jgi:hypothetical protein
MRTLRGDDDADDGQFAAAMEEHMDSYDEALYYACKEYMRAHALYYKQLKRRTKPDELPLRYMLLMLWTRPLATIAGQCYFAFQCLLVIISITQLVLETIPRYSATVYPDMRVIWDSIEVPTSFFFLLDIVLHMALLPAVPNDYSRYSRRTYVRKIQFWLDVLTVLPTFTDYMTDLWPSVPSLGFLKALRILRFTKVLRQFHAVDQLASTLERAWKPLLGPFLFLFAVLITMSGAIYYVEHGDYDPATQMFVIDDFDCLMSAPRTLNPLYPCPKLDSKFVSLPQTLWFCLVTLTTVGYGDMVPRSTLGRACATVCILCGNVLTAMPIAIVGTYFTDIVTANRRRQEGDAARAFGPKGDQGPTSLPRRLVPGPGDPAAAAGSSTTLSASSLTVGERLLDMLACSGGTIDLLEPAGSMVHQVNAFMKQEFDTFIASLDSVEGVRQAKAAKELALDDLVLVPHLKSSSSSTCTDSGVVSLNKPMPFVCGTLPGLTVPLTVGGAPLPGGLPAVVFIAYASTAGPHALSIKAVFPAVVRVNGDPVGYDAPTTLLIGDMVTLHAQADDPAVVTYQYLLSQEVPAVPSADAAPGDSTTKKRSTGGAEAVGIITLRAAASPPDHRGMTFAAFTARPGCLPFDDL